MGDDASPEECRQRCSGYNYMGLQYLDTCMCGNAASMSKPMPGGRVNSNPSV
ncbi:MAG: WSC domain-containing protein [Myxococcota bacterium]